MNKYYECVYKEINTWHKDIIRREKLMSKVSSGIQSKTQKLVPKKVQDTLTTTIKTFTEAILYSSDFLSDYKYTNGLTLSESDYLVLQLYKTYKAVAVSEGALTGAGGFIVGLADFPALLAIEIKFLFDCAALYGYDTSDHKERVFMLYVFQLAFSNHNHRQECFEKLAYWENQNIEEIDWKKLQIEYRDYVDIAKMLQLLPIIGSPVGAVSNNNLMERLRENVMNSYRMRRLKIKW